MKERRSSKNDRRFYFNVQAGPFELISNICHCRGTKQNFGPISVVK